LVPKYLDAKESGDEVDRRRAFQELLELTDGKFNGKTQIMKMHKPRIRTDGGHGKP